MFKSLELGEIFVKYDHDTDKVYYIKDLPSSKKKEHKTCLICLKLNEEKDLQPDLPDVTWLNF